MNSRRPRQKPHGAGLPNASIFKARKGKLSGGIIAISTAAIVSVYTLGRSNTSAVSNQFLADAPTAVASVAPSAPAGGGVPARPTATPSNNGSQSTQSAAYKDGTYTGSGTSRHGGMEVEVVIQGGKIVSANVTSCSTRYPCSDIDPLIGLTVSQQSVPANHVSGATDSSRAYRQAVTNALAQAKA